MFIIKHNGYVYETFGISKHFPVKLQQLLIRAEMLDNPLIAECFIYDVMPCYFISSLIDVSNRSISILSLLSKYKINSLIFDDFF